ncbi:TIGR03016 family PEP-CTERM system-associated outer membrane protein [Desulfohalovibrio reitneri]|uniref:TIGR03016 family PEP-CTERM system-associated outer membrane protein n=1 Tax=Desulfohalovibrio reitneri TaxID=1307759 RepID=UPI0004A73FC5|nr:TIGR03016 family PEP-CTERM system-associated outer membrane protein [Desulfohalovibrio reitneri]
MRYPLFCAALLFLLLPASALAETLFDFSLGVAEEYISNVNEAPSGEGEEDYATSLRPTASFLYEKSRLLLEADYSASFIYYALQNREDEAIHNLQAHGLLEAVEDFLFLDVTESVRQVNRDVTRGETVEGDTTERQVTQNTFAASPYTLIRLGQRGEAKTGYRFSKISYFDGEGEGRTEHQGFTDLTYEMTGRLTSLGGYSLTRSEADTRDYTRHLAYLGANYAYAEDSSAYFKAGPSIINYSDQEDSTTRFFWNAGLTHVMGSVTASLDTGLDYEDDPLADTPTVTKYAGLTVSKNFERSTAAVFTRVEDYDRDVAPENTVSSADADTGRHYVVGVRGTHQLSERWSANADARWDLQDRDVNDVTRWYTGVGLNYEIGHGFTAGTWYRLKLVSGDREEDKYNVNRVGVQLTKHF